jgi:O-antigen ligase
MKKILSFLKENLLFVGTLFLLFFIPLYPKIPLVNVSNTWVYVRAEDFVVLLVLFFWLSLLFRKKVTLKTPLTAPIMIFWIVGAIATIHGIVLFFPGLPNVFPNVAFLSYLRHIEYMSLFFLAYASMQKKSFLIPVIVTLTMTLFIASLYGIGQKYFGFPAYLTMNEEFAKGIPIQLSALSRISSTFAGHYDFAAYLVLVLPIMVSLIFGVKKWALKILFALVSLVGLIALFMTVSRVSVFVLLISLFIVFLFQKRKIVFLLVPGIIAIGFLFLIFRPTILSRFSSTISEVDVLVDAKTGAAIGEVKFVESAEYLKDKKIDQALTDDKAEVDLALRGAIDTLQMPVDEEVGEPKPLKFPKEIPLARAANISNGESLPQGTGYVNLSLAPVTKRLGSFFYELSPNLTTTTSAQVIIVHGSFLVKRAAAYDLSFTTRFQGEWPHAIEAFERNVFLGSGYGSVSLAVDNNYLRMLGEVGLFGTIAFLAILVSAGTVIVKAWRSIDSKVTKSFVLGFCAGVVGLVLNATLIDVFEASKIAFVLWLLMGFVLGQLALYKPFTTDSYQELRKILFSPVAIVVYLLAITGAVYSQLVSNYFVGDDFTWFRWAAECSSSCPSTFTRIFQFFTDSQGFFYRPGTKVFFLFMYSSFWLNQVVYHIVSISLHFIVSVLFYFLARKILKNNLFAAFAGLLFLMLSGYSEVVFWISSTGYLFNAVFALSAILLFSLWEERKKKLYLVLSTVCIVFGLFFHEAGIVTPLLVILYAVVRGGKFNFKDLKKKVYYLLLAPIPLYLAMRFMAQSHWLSGDYSYNIFKLPLNFIGNVIGYFGVVSVGTISIPLYESLRNLGRENIFGTLLISTIAIIAGLIIYKKIIPKISSEGQRIILFGSLFFIISLLPFLGLGNITSRYSYLASLGFILIFVYGIKKIYEYLEVYGRDISGMAVVIIISVFSLLHIIQIQQAHQDWNTAGNKVQKFFTSIDEVYESSWSTNEISLHFVNVPLRVNDAWIFPVGLKDALWFAFRNPDLKVYIESDLDKALYNAGDSLSDIVFKFNDDGSVTEVVRLKNGVPINVLRQFAN